jgi:2-haloalkanoic acid dehalogenase type II
MSYRAVLVDFYGTLVAEDDAVITRIVELIAQNSPVCSDKGQIARDWRWTEVCSAACGSSFRAQRTLELESLGNLLAQYEAGLDALSLSEELFAYWTQPAPYEDADWFVRNIDLPICVVSNSDEADLRNAITSVGWTFDRIVTSEGCRHYKPHPVIFQNALALLGCSAHEVLHVGDSLSSDVVGAQQLGIDVAWINRQGRSLPSHIPVPTYEVTSLRALHEVVLSAHPCNHARPYGMHQK